MPTNNKKSKLCQVNSSKALFQANLTGIFLMVSELYRVNFLSCTSGYTGTIQQIQGSVEIENTHAAGVGWRVMNNKVFATHLSCLYNCVIVYKLALSFLSWRTNLYGLQNDDLLLQIF